MSKFAINNNIKSYIIQAGKANKLNGILAHSFTSMATNAAFNKNASVEKDCRVVTCPSISASIKPF